MVGGCTSGRARTVLPALALAGILALLVMPARAGGGDAPAAGEEVAGADVSFDGHVRPFLRRYCRRCHGGKRPQGELDLAAYKDSASILQGRQQWKRVLQMLVHREMPPAEKRQPSDEERERVSRWIHTELEKFDCSGDVDPGRVTIRRLNRAEYDNTVRDLLGVDFQPADEFPADEVGYGFDNIGDVLSLPPLLVEKYLDAAERVVDAAVSAELSGDDTSGAPRIFVARPDDARHVGIAARRVLQQFLRRAWRRPATSAELDRFVRLVERAAEDGDTFEEAVSVALKAALVSPPFLFRVEIHPHPENRDAVEPVSDWELASRLSYFLWSTMPDEELLLLAEAGRLGESGVLDEQVKRLLADSRSRAFVDNFAGQWLKTRQLSEVAPDPGVFPQFDEELRAAMATETSLFFETILDENRSILEFLDASWTFVNERLARHYGLEGVEGEEFRRVDLPAGGRGGIITQASILTLTSNPTRTSPVKRGIWVLEQILAEPPPPPPPDVPTLAEQEAALSGSLRQRMEQHRKNPACAQCHERMDALGFALENFDAIGSWRETDGEFPIDPSGELPGGREFRGPSEMKELLKSEIDTFAHALAEKLLTYALGRGLEYYDKCALDSIVEFARDHEYRFGSMIAGVVRAAPFRMRRGEGED